MPLQNLRHLGMLAALVALTACPAVVMAATVTVDVYRDGDALQIRASAFLEAEAATAWRVLTDYDRYADFIPGVHASRVVARRGDVVEVEQYDDALFSPLHFPLRITYQITEIPPDRVWSRAAVDALPTLESSYLLTSTPFGARLDYTGQVAGGSTLLGRIEQWTIQRNVARQLQALADRIERSEASSRTAPP